MKRHKPSVIFLPGIDTWYQTLSESVITTFCGLLKALPPTDPVLVLGILDCPTAKANPDMVRNLFGFSRNNQFNLQRPSRVSDFTHFRLRKADSSRNSAKSFSLILSHMPSWRQRTSPSRSIVRRGSWKC